MILKIIFRPSRLPRSGNGVIKFFGRYSIYLYSVHVNSFNFISVILKVSNAFVSFLDFCMSIQPHFVSEIFEKLKIPMSHEAGSMRHYISDYRRCWGMTLFLSAASAAQGVKRSELFSEYTEVAPLRSRICHPKKIYIKPIGFHVKTFFL